MITANLKKALSLLTERASSDNVQVGKKIKDIVGPVFEKCFGLGFNNVVQLKYYHEKTGTLLYGVMESEGSPEKEGYLDYAVLPKGLKSSTREFKNENWDNAEDYIEQHFEGSPISIRSYKDLAKYINIKIEECIPLGVSFRVY